MEDIRKRQGESEDDLDIRYREKIDTEEPQRTTTSSQQPTGSAVKSNIIDSDDSKNIPLAKLQSDKDPHVRYTHQKFISHKVRNTINS